VTVFFSSDTLNPEPYRGTSYKRGDHVPPKSVVMWPYGVWYPALTLHTLNPKPSTPPQLYTMKSNPQTLNPMPETQSPKSEPYTLDPNPKPLNPQLEP